ncbi:hypothetical protein PV08_01190 [Exophiala spinifera]|uniref:Helicase ATP-binding domain-containing protein n=1 Tax=Exophiala spinifera TaxID=91928 RepID=A0A0D2BQ39_9EURO|nr:uncharacterized protein PV08_01190 [Exophiala spinifera]KIW20615.1 hypothetical protein PV08_01190 [Exophiala spinifera]
MNANLPERFRGGGARRNYHAAATTNSSAGFDMTLNLDIREYSNKQESIKATSDQDDWLSMPEFPTAEELLGDGPQLLANKIKRPYKSKEKYLKIHYDLQREDAIGSLRDALQEFRSDPTMNDTHDFSIYDQVYIVGFTFPRRSLAARVRFSTRRAGKRISWSTSKRLVSGSIVVLMRAKDKRVDLSRLIVAVVAARPLSGVELDTPEIDLTFTDTEAVQIDPQEEFIMLESKQGYYEAYRHTLRALQKLSQETFPLADHICKLDPSVRPPAYIEHNPVLDLSAAAKIGQKKDYEKVNVLQNWPATPKDSLDDTQWEALRDLITKRLAIIQGPPGTGKTYVSKVAVEILLRNRKSNDPPIIIAAQTNHALDQLLGHISLFEPEYVRLGGRSTSPEVKQHALFEVRQKDRINLVPGGVLGRSNALLSKQSKLMCEILEPFTKPGSDPYSTEQKSGPKVLQQLGVLTEAQVKSLEDGASQWVSASDSMDGPIRLWLDRALIPFEVKYAKEDYGFQEVEDEDLEFEQLRENEDSHGVNDEEDIELLKGPWVGISERFTVRPASSSDIAKATRLLDSVSDLWQVPDHLRAAMFSVIQTRAKSSMARQFRECAAMYEKLIRDNQVGKWEQDSIYLKRAPIIGMTTTGFSKYRGLISSLKPKIILIEEAAEVLEAPVTVACIESLEHLILVGDHQQLQGHCSLQDLENDPFYLNVSLFERLVSNNMPYKTLLQQRRMEPEFRRLIQDLYPKLSDHPSVLNRSVEPWGMGPLKSFFFDHRWSEYKDDSLSTYNEEEAKFIAGFYRHLNKNGVQPHQITVLTFYNGQRKKLLKELRLLADITAGYLQVKTVDSYQGEENDIVILSLTRSNEEGKIGFLANINRVCVALSRARLGFYMFGNSHSLMAGCDLWYNVIKRMSIAKRMGQVLPVQCKTHQETLCIQYPQEWAKTDGGCFKVCSEKLACGHSCPLRCHPFSHNKFQCPEPCTKTLPCGHGCEHNCSEPCYCCCAEFAKYQALRSQEIWTELDAEGIKKGVQEVRMFKEANGQSIPSHGSNIHSQPQIPKPRNTGPSYRDAVVAPEDEAPLRTSPEKPKPGSKQNGNVNPTAMRTVETRQLSPEKQQNRKERWTKFAKGGVETDDQRLVDLSESQSRREARLNDEQDDGLEQASTLLPYPNTRTAAIAQETIKTLPGGRNRFLHDFQPEAVRGRGASNRLRLMNGGQHGDTDSAQASKNASQAMLLEGGTTDWNGLPPVSNCDSVKIGKASGTLIDLQDLDSYYRD